MSLTKNQERFLELLREYIEAHDMPPTLEEMKIWMESHGWPEIRSLNSVKQYFDALEEAGSIRRESRKRGVSLVDRKSGERSEMPVSETVFIPVLASPVACGSPTTLMDEEAVDQLEISPKLIHSLERTYAFRASGDSMNQAGIDDGDFVLVESTPELRDGDIVLATINGCGTLKRFRRNASCISLLPESSNPEHKPIYLHEDDEFVIGGKVINILKN